MKNNNVLVNNLLNLKLVQLLIKDIENEEKFDFKWINKSSFKNIKYLNRNEFHNDKADGIYHVIQFSYPDSFNEKIISKFVNYIKEIFEEESDYNEILKSIIFYFKKYYKQSNLFKLHGDIGEAIFILKCLDIDENLGRKVLNSMHNEDESSFDFYPSSNHALDVKTTTFSTSEINVSSNQTKMQSLNVDIVVVKTRFTQKQSLIIDSYKMIDKKIGLNDLLERNLEFYKHESELVETNTIDLRDVKVCFYNKELLPNFSNINAPSIKKVTYTLDASDNSLCSTEFKEKISQIYK